MATDDQGREVPMESWTALRRVQQQARLVTRLAGILFAVSCVALAVAASAMVRARAGLHGEHNEIRTRQVTLVDATGRERGRLAVADKQVYLVMRGPDAARRVLLVATDDGMSSLELHHPEDGSYAELSVVPSRSDVVLHGPHSFSGIIHSDMDTTALYLRDRGDGGEPQAGLIVDPDGHVRMLPTDAADGPAPETAGADPAPGNDSTAE